MKSPASLHSFGKSSSRLSNYSRSFDLPDDPEIDVSGDDYGVGGAMLPIFLSHLQRNNQQDLVEVTLELENDSIVFCSVAPSTPAPIVTDEREATASVTASSSGILGRSLSATSRIRKKFGKFLSRSSSRASSSAADINDQINQERRITARDERRIKAKLQRTKSSAERALKGLRFISKNTTGANDAEQMWKRVELRFKSLEKDGLLAREDFGECIGPYFSYPVWQLRKRKY